MATGVFITGTDTGVGKTWFTVALMEALKAHGHDVLGMKPIASGAELVAGSLINEDAKLILEHGSKPKEYKLINPCVYQPPIAPHIAAEQAGQNIELNTIAKSYEQLSESTEILVVEGVGGWRVPVSDAAYLSDLVRMLELPVILVVGLRLGCINHALLTAESIHQDGVKLLGWVSNQLEEELPYKNEIIITLNERLACPHLAEMGFMPGFESKKLSEQVDLTKILDLIKV